MKKMCNDRHLEILVVEDNPGDARLAKEAFKESSYSNSISVVEDGTEALCFLRREGEYCSAPCPDVILLDLNLPKIDGRELLAEIKKDSNLKNIPVIILTGSTAAHDILSSYNMHAIGYLTKPVDSQQFDKIMANFNKLDKNTQQT